MTTRLRRRAGEVSIDDQSNVHLKPAPGKSTVLGKGSALAYASDEYADEGSFQPVAVDLNLDPAAGTSDAGDSSFLGAIMGNVLGAILTKTHNFIGGLIGALSVTGAKGSDLQVGAVVGIVMDGVTEADGAVVAVIDGGDPSSVTRANAAFAARMNNNDAGSGVDYGLDLYDPGRDETLYTGGGEPLAIAKAIIRTPSQVCVMEGAGVPVDGTTGDNFAAVGSIYIDVTNAEAYINAGTITDSVWKKITRAA